MEKPTLESLQQELERQDRELEELMECVARIDPRDVPDAFFEELDALCEATVAPPVTTNLTSHVFGLRV